MNIDLIKPNPNNPRTIKKDKFDKLVKSIKSFPEMLEARPLILNQDNIVLGGNMRLKALQKAGIKDVPVVHVNWDAEKESEFIIKDNLSYGDWDYDIIANEWDLLKLEDWGFDLPNMKETEKLSGLEYKPIYYEPENTPNIKLKNCIDFDLYNKKIEYLEALELESEIKELLKILAHRFIKIDFEKIADYYTFNANNNEQLAIERLRLVLTDNGVNGFIEDDILKIYDGLFVND